MDSGGLILYCSRIRKNITFIQRTENREKTDNRQRTDRETIYRGHSNHRTDGTPGGAGQ